MTTPKKQDDISKAVVALKRIVSEDEDPRGFKSDSSRAERYVLEPELRVKNENDDYEPEQEATFEEKLAQLEIFLSDMENELSEGEETFPDAEILQMDETVQEEALASYVSILDETESKDKGMVNKSRKDENNSHLPLDKEELRVLVAELIREELSGVLGEKITANIRKMVQAEVTIAKLGSTEQF